MKIELTCICDDPLCKGTIVFTDGWIEVQGQSALKLDKDLMRSIGAAILCWQSQEGKEE